MRTMCWYLKEIHIEEHNVKYIFFMVYCWKTIMFFPVQTISYVTTLFLHSNSDLEIAP